MIEDIQKKTVEVVSNDDLNFLLTELKDDRQYFEKEPEVEEVEPEEIEEVETEEIEEVKETDSARHERLGKTTDFIVKSLDSLVVLGASSISGGDDGDKYKTDEDDLDDVKVEVRNYIKTSKNFNIPVVWSLIIVVLLVYVPKLLMAFGDRKKKRIEEEKEEKEIETKNKDKDLAIESDLRKMTA